MENLNQVMIILRSIAINFNISVYTLLNINKNRKYTNLELFAGARGLALGLEQAGFTNLLVNDFDKDSYNTLHLNHLVFNVICDSIENLLKHNYKKNLILKKEN